MRAALKGAALAASAANLYAVPPDKGLRAPAVLSPMPGAVYHLITTRDATPRSAASRPRCSFRHGDVLTVRYLRTETVRGRSVVVVVEDIGPRGGELRDILRFDAHHVAELREIVARRESTTRIGLLRAVRSALTLTAKAQTEGQSCPG